MVGPHQTMTDPEFDDDGYPTDATLAVLEAWPDANGALQFMRAAWHWPEAVRDDLSAHEGQVVHAEPEDRYLRFATGGWSGNDSLIAALRQNHMAWALTWCLTARGGLHIFRLRAE